MLNVSKAASAYGASQVLWDIDLDIDAGEAVALLGRNGVGKTTLLRTIVGLQPLTQGDISFDDQRISREAPFRRARRGIAYVPQGRGIFAHLSVTENLQVAQAAVGTRGAAESDALPDDIFELFPVLHELGERKGGNLSGGQQQQLAIARALVTRPRLLLLDEPTEGIQPSIVAQIETALRTIRRDLNVAVLLVEQYLDFAWNFADRYYVMQKGRIVDAGQTAERDQSAVSGLLSI